MTKEDVRESGTAARVSACVCNILLVVLTVLGMVSFFTRGGDGNMSVVGSRCFVFFTVDSNILAAVAAAVCLAWELRGRKPPRAAAAFKLTGAVSVAVTFFTVLLFLGPVFGFRGMYAGVNFFMHLASPLLAMISVCFFEFRPQLRFRSIFLGLLPTVVYGAVYLTMVVLLRKWMDFYGFNMGGMWPLSFALMLLATWLLSLLLWAVRRAVGRREARKTGIAP
jgi:hypothetical protein